MNATDVTATEMSTAPSNSTAGDHRPSAGVRTGQYGIRHPGMTPDTARYALWQLLQIGMSPTEALHTCTAGAASGLSLVQRPGDGGDDAVPRIVRCPSSGCSAPADVYAEAACDSTDGPVWHARTLCLNRHFYQLPVEYIPGYTSATGRPASTPASGARSRSRLRERRSDRASQERETISMNAITLAELATDPTGGLAADNPPSAQVRDEHMEIRHLGRLADPRRASQHDQPPMASSRLRQPPPQRGQLPVAPG